MKALLVKPQVTPVEIETDGSLTELQNLVGGYIEAPCLFPDVDIIINEEGKLMNLPYNRWLSHNGKFIDILVGNIVIIAHDDEGETIGLTEEQILKYTAIFNDLIIEI